MAPAEPTPHCGSAAVWTQALAAAICTRTAIPPSAAAGLRAAFVASGARELRVVLANGHAAATPRGGADASALEAEAYDVYALIAGGEVAAEPLAALGGLPAGGTTLAQRAMLAKKPLAAVAGREGGAAACPDWAELRAGGAGWALAAPLTCCCMSAAHR